MKTLSKYIPSFALALLAITFLSGCTSARGPKFALSGDATVKPPAGQALVFIYRTPNMVDAANSWIVGMNGQHLVTVPNGGYHNFTVAPGTLRFVSRFEDNPLNFGLATLFNKDREVLKLEAQPDTIHYLKLFVGGLEEIPAAKAVESLVKCKKILPEEPGTTLSNSSRYGNHPRR